MQCELLGLELARRHATLCESADAIDTYGVMGRAVQSMLTTLGPSLSVAVAGALRLDAADQSEAASAVGVVVGAVSRHIDLEHRRIAEHLIPQR